jgi:hypothetical protein
LRACVIRRRGGRTWSRGRGRGRGSGIVSRINAAAVTAVVRSGRAVCRRCDIGRAVAVVLRARGGLIWSLIRRLIWRSIRLQCVGRRATRIKEGGCKTGTWHRGGRRYAASGSWTCWKSGCRWRKAFWSWLACAIAG